MIKTVLTLMLLSGAAFADCNNSGYIDHIESTLDFSREMARWEAFQPQINVPDRSVTPEPMDLPEIEIDINFEY